jgi:spore photoproduct lyase
VIMPMIPLPGWRGAYEQLLCEVLDRVRLDRITLGGICSFPAARRLMEAKLGADNAISAELRQNTGRSSDGRSRYSPARRIDMYGHLIHIIRREAPSLGIGLCLEEREVFEALGLEERIGKCNCVL